MLIIIIKVKPKDSNNSLGAFMLDIAKKSSQSKEAR